MEGHEVVASYAEVPGTPWTLIVETDWAQAMAPVQRFATGLIVLLGLGMIVPTLGVALLARGQKSFAPDAEDPAQDARLNNLMRQRLLPRHAPMIGGWDVAVHHQTATKNSSARDLYDFMLLPDGRLMLSLATVADKGLGGLQLMTTARAAMRTAACQTPSAGQALSLCNNMICPDLGPESAIASLLALLDPPSGRLQVANAGLSAPLRWGGQSGELVEMREGTSLLGQSLDIEYEHDDILLAPGESIVFYSPGALGARPETGEPFGPERVRRVLGASGATGAQAITDALRMDLAEFADGDSLSHLDVTFLVLARPPSTNKIEKTRRSLRDEFARARRDRGGLVVMSQRVDWLERLSRFVTVAAAGVATISVILAPLLALSWAKQPFPGFLMDHTLVVTDQNGEGWTGRAAGITFGQRVTRLGGSSVENDRDYQEVLDSLEIGRTVSIFTELREGGTKYFPSVELMAFAARDLFRLFWMPYLMGLAYLSIGAWIYVARGATRPGRALAFFCFAAGISQALYFDVFSSHVGTPVWAIAIAALGGSLLSLAMRFPQEARLVQRHPVMLIVPYIISLAIGIWAAVSLYNTDEPWQYLIARDVSYRWAGIGALLFLGTMFHRAFRGSEATVRRQARIVLLGSAIAFLPIIVWIMTPVVGIRLHFEPTLYMPWLVIFPFSVAIAIFRYRLLEMDSLVNRTILWGLLTAVLAGVVSVSITILQRLFQAFTGEKSDVAVVLTSLILVSVFTPVKTRLQAFLDRTFKDSPEHIRALARVRAEVRTYTQMTDARLMTRRLLEEAAIGMEAQCGAISLVTPGSGRLETAHTYGDWRGEAWIAAPLEYAGERQGLLMLGPREGLRPYSRQEFDALQNTANEVAHTLAVGSRNGHS